MYNDWVWAQSRLSNSSICVVTFWESFIFKLLNKDDKNVKKFYIKLFRNLRAYFSIEIFSINQC